MPSSLDDLRRVQDLQRALGQGFRVGSLLGRGGCAEVYSATDEQLRRPIAVKVLRPEFLGAAGVAERFLREARAVATLRHPNIIPIYQVGEAGGLAFFVMPVIQGESLQRYMDRVGRLPIVEARRILGEVADALDCAHRSGLVHRDIKPDNILLEGDDRRAIVTDFGIAKAMESSEAALTIIGVVIGTPRYMSPEQASAERTIDHRSDLYSLGVVAYEMLTGQAPFSGTSAREQMAHHLTTHPADPRTVRADIAADVSAAVLRCLQKKPADRWNTALEFAAAIRGSAAVPAQTSPAPAGIGRRSRPKLIIAAAAVVTAVLVIAGALVPRPIRATAFALLTRDQARLNPKRVVVAPFDNETGDTAFSALGGMASDHITRELMRTGLVEVVDARTSLLTSRMVELTPRIFRAGNRARALAEETGAGLVIWGSYYRHRDSLQFQAQITDVASGTVLRAIDAVSGSVDAKEELVERLRQRTTAALGQVVDTTLATWMTRLSPPPSYAAYRELARGFESYMQLDMAEGVRRIQLAAALDSSAVTPLLVLAYGLLDLLRWAEADSVIQRLEGRRDQLIPAEQVWVDVLRAWVRGDHATRLRALREYRRLTPASSEIATLLARFATTNNHPREAIDLLEEVDPRRGLLLVTDLYWIYLTAAHHQLGEHGEELRVAKRGRRQFPSRMFAFHSEARALAALGRTDDLRAVLAGARIDPPAQTTAAAARDVAGAWNRLRHGFHLETIREVRAHGRADESRRLADDLVVTLRSEDAADTAASGRFLLLSALYVAGRWDEAQAIAAELLARDPSNVHYLGAAGCVAARRGDRAEASRVAALLAANREPYLFGRPSYYRARIASLMGDKPDAVRLLQQALSEGTDGWFPMPRAGRRQFWGGETNIHTDIDFESLRDFPPFRQIVTPTG